MIAGWFLGNLAMDNLAQQGDEWRRKVLWRGPLAGRHYFTDEGWRYRKLSMICFGLIIVLALVWGVFEALT
jgi:hypothetical protein